MPDERHSAERELAPAGVALTSATVDAILAHARAEAPNEACGLVAGDGVAGSGVAFHPARNTLASPYRFDLHPEDLVRILDDIERAGLELVAIVHSHPRSAAVPSALDDREARYRVPYLIVGVGDGIDVTPVLRAWWIDSEAAEELPLQVIDDDQQSVDRLSRIRRATGSSTMSSAHDPSSFPER